MADGKVPVMSKGHYRSFNPGEVFYVAKAELDAESKRERPRIFAAPVDKVPKPPKVEAKPDKK